MKQIKNMYKLIWIKKDDNNLPKEDSHICFLIYRNKKWWFGMGYLDCHIYEDDIDKPDKWRIIEGFEEWTKWDDINYWCYKEDFMKLILDKEIIKFE
jgi:hypothetical protein